MKLYRKKNSQYYWADFVVAGKRYRISTKETQKTRAEAIAALKLSQAVDGNDPLPKKAGALRDLSRRFLEWADTSRLADKSKTYYHDGWRLLSVTDVAGMRLDQITADVAGRLQFPGSASNSNCALRTLRRMLRKAVEWKVIRHAPKIKLVKEYGRTLRLDAEAEKKLLAGAIACQWRKGSFQRFQDIVVLVRDTGLRNEKELYRLRAEHLDWDHRVIFVADSKTPEGRRNVPMSNRVVEILQRRCGSKREGWIFASKRSESGHLTTMANRFREARRKAGLPENLVLYCGRHDFGTRVLQKTGNLAAVMKTMGHKDVKTAMQYQHPELEVVRAALDEGQVINPQAV